jgi:hypothetical protein
VLEQLGSQFGSAAAGGAVIVAVLMSASRADGGAIPRAV